MPLQYSFAGKKVLVTGGAHGIGRTIVQKFHEDGAQVYTIDKNQENIEKLRVDFPGVRAEVADVADWEATQKLVESFGAIDHLINNAGIMRPQKFMNITKENANLHFDVNVLGTINVTQAVARVLIEQGKEGSVVNIGSIAARRGNPAGASLYAASKAALENLTKSMAIELGAHKIRVNCILPGIVNAPPAHGGGVDMDAALLNMISPRLVVKQLVDRAEIADLAMYLLSPLATMISGQGVVIDCGYLVN